MDSKGGGRAKAGEFETELEKILIYQTGPKWDRWMKKAKGRKSHATFPLNYYAEVTCCRNPMLVGQVFVGGSLLHGGPVKVVRDPELSVKIQLLGGGGGMCLNVVFVRYFLELKIRMRWISWDNLNLREKNIKHPVLHSLK
jgi:hypothetical protein